MTKRLVVQEARELRSDSQGSGWRRSLVLKRRSPIRWRILDSDEPFARQLHFLLLFKSAQHPSSLETRKVLYSVKSLLGSLFEGFTFSCFLIHRGEDSCTFPPFRPLQFYEEASIRSGVSPAPPLAHQLCLGLLTPIPLRAPIQYSSRSNSSLPKNWYHSRNSEVVRSGLGSYGNILSPSLSEIGNRVVSALQER